MPSAELALVASVAKLLNEELGTEATIAAVAETLRRGLPAEGVTIWHREHGTPAFRSVEAPPTPDGPAPVRSLDLVSLRAGWRRYVLEHEGVRLGLLEARLGDAVVLEHVPAPAAAQRRPGWSNRTGWAVRRGCARRPGPCAGRPHQRVSATAAIVGLRLPLHRGDGGHGAAARVLSARRDGVDAPLAALRRRSAVCSIHSRSVHRYHNGSCTTRHRQVPLLAIVRPEHAEIKPLRVQPLQPSREPSAK